MDNEYFKVVRLKTGESILCSMSNNVKSLIGETHLSLTMPVQVIHQNETQRQGQVLGESFFLRPWIGLSDSEDFVISTDIILTIGDLRLEVKNHYINYVEQTIETQKRTRDAIERSNAADTLLREAAGGKLNIIDEYTIGDGYDNEDHERD